MKRVARRIRPATPVAAEQVIASGSALRRPSGARRQRCRRSAPKRSHGRSAPQLPPPQESERDGTYDEDDHHDERRRPHNAVEVSCVV